MYVLNQQKPQTFIPSKYYTRYRLLKCFASIVYMRTLQGLINSQQ